MITVVKEFMFSAAHYLPEYDGPCQNIHGHDYKLQVGVKGLVDESGMVMDFTELKRIVNEQVINVLDHQFLNGLPNCWGFPKHMPTAENMLDWIAQQLSRKLFENGRHWLWFLRLYETPTSYAEWRRE
jgi:6-pyruvoyltetrahydropterin/6-carboxytetrahydropterin synthase